MRQLPDEVQDGFGSQLLEAQCGYQPLGARSFGERLPHQIMKLADDFGGNTYRLAYTTFPDAVYVLDVFMKKSKTGIETPLQIRQRVIQRYREATRLYELNYLPPKK